MIWKISFFINSVFAKPRITPEPFVKPIGEVDGSSFALAFSSIQEYRDVITVLVSVSIIAFREYFQYRKDRDRLNAMEEKQKKDSEIIASLERNQSKMTIKFDEFIKAVEKSERLTERRLERIETMVDKR